MIYHCCKGDFFTKAHEDLSICN